MRGVIALACRLCKAIEDKAFPLLYEDDEVIVFLSQKPASPGHVIAVPKEHYTILEQVPNNIMGKLGWIANKVSVAVFEALGMQGTNIIVNNGVAAGQNNAHFMFNIIPRKENDGLNFMWEPKKIEESELNELQSKIEQNLKEPVVEENEVKEEAKEEPKAKATIADGLSEESSGDDDSTEEEDEEEENYLIRQLRRIP